MALLFLAMVQATSSVPSENIDLPIRQQCKAQRSTSDEVVVCARRGDGSSPYRIKQMPPAQSDIPKAELQLGDKLSASADMESYGVGGFPSNRMMVRLKIKF
ncbi:MAG: hypothetical protein ABI422_04920 [Sphingomicrobium sp.]